MRQRKKSEVRKGVGICCGKCISALFRNEHMAPREAETIASRGCALRET